MNDATMSQHGNSLIRSVVKKIHEQTQKVTEFHEVSEGFDCKLKKLKVEVLPEMGRVEFDREKNRAKFNVSINPTDARHGNSRIVALERYFQDFKGGRVDIVGVAGSGKTTLLKVIARLVMARRLICLDDVELVFYLDCQALPSSSKLTDILFHNIDIKLSEANAIISYIHEHPSKSLFIVDSVDNIESGADNFRGRSGKKKSDDPALVVSKLINGNTFTKPGFRVITSGREHTLAVTSSKIQQRIYALCGLTPPCIDRIVKGYLGDIEGNKFMKELTTHQSPSLRSLCTIPVFLTYTLMGRSDKNFASSKMSGVISVLLNNFFRSQHASANIKQTICKLKQLSLKGIKSNRVVFSDHDLKENNLDSVSKNELIALRGLVYMSPGQRRLFQFNHLSIQEMLAAMCVAEKKFSRFTEHFKSEFENPVYAIVHRLVFGLLFDSEVFSASQGILEVEGNVEKKKVFLKNLVIDQLDQNHGVLDDLKLLRILHEAGNGLKEVVSEHVHSIDITGKRFPLSLDDAFLIASVTTSCSRLDRLSVSQTALQPQSARILSENIIKKSSTRITELKASKNPDIGEGIADFGKLACTSQSKVVDVHGCNLTEQAIEHFQQSLGNHNVDEVDLSISNNPLCDWNEEEESKTAKVYYNLAPQDLQSNDLTKSQILALRNTILSTKVEFPLNMVGTWKRASTNVLDAILHLIPKVGKKLRLHGWKFTDQQRKKLSETIESLPTGLTVSFASGDSINSKELSRWRDGENVDAEKTPDGILVKWKPNADSNAYLVLMYCNGEQYGEAQRVKGTDYHFNDVEPSKNYLFEIQSLNADGTVGKKIVSRYSTTSDPPKLTNVFAELTSNGIRVAWSAKTEVGRFRLRIFENGIQLLKKVIETNEYLHANLVPNATYQFYVCAMSKNDMLGEEAESKVLHTWKCHEGTPIEIPEVAKQTAENEQERSDETTSLGDLPSNDQQNLPQASDIERSKSEQVNNELNTQDHEEEKAPTNIPQDCPMNIIDSKEFSDFLKENKRIFWEEIQLAHEPLTRDRANVVSFMVRTSKEVADVEFRDCTLSVESLETFHEFINDSNVSVSEFSVTAENDVASLIPTICKILRACKSNLLNLGENDMSDETLTILKKHLEKIPVKTLHCLDVSYNKDLSDFEVLAEILDLCPISDLRLMNCDIGEDALAKLRSSKSRKLKRFNLSYNPDLTPECMETVADLVSDEEVEFIGLSECEITADEMSSLRQALESRNTSLVHLDVSYNDNLLDCGILEVGLTVKGSNVRELNLTGCDLDARLISTLRLTLKSHQLSKLDLSDNKSLHNGVTEVARMVADCPVERLGMNGCMLNGNQISSFVKSLGAAKLKSLDVSDGQRIVDSDHIRAVCLLLPHVTDELTACFANVTEHETVLQQELDKCDSQHLHVVYGYSPERVKSFHKVSLTVGANAGQLVLRQKNTLK